MSLTLNFQGQDYCLTVLKRKPHLVVEVDGRAYTVCSEDETGLTVNGQHHAIRRDVHGNAIHVWSEGRLRMVDFVDPRDAAQSSTADDDEIRAPMPGLVVSIEKPAGSAVKRGDPVVVIESMKLQASLCAARDGVVQEVGKSEGAVFEKDEVLATLVKEED